MKVLSSNTYSLYQKEALQTALTTTVLTLMASAVIHRVITSRAPKEKPAPKVWTPRVSLGLGAFALTTLGVSCAIFKPLVNRKAFLDTLFLESYAAIDKEKNKDQYLRLITLEAKHHPQRAAAKIRALPKGDQKRIADLVIVPIGAADLDLAYELLKGIPTTDSPMRYLVRLGKYDFKKCVSKIDSAGLKDYYENIYFSHCLKAIPKEMREGVYQYIQEASHERIERIFDTFGKDEDIRALSKARQLEDTKKLHAFTGLLPHLLKNKGFEKAFEILKGSFKLVPRSLLQLLYDEGFKQGKLPENALTLFKDDCKFEPYVKSEEKVLKELAEKFDSIIHRDEFYENYFTQPRMVLKFLESRINSCPKKVVQTIKKLLDSKVYEPLEFVKTHRQSLAPYLKGCLVNSWNFPEIFEQDIQIGWELFDLIEKEKNKQKLLTSILGKIGKDVAGFIKRAKLFEDDSYKSWVLLAVAKYQYVEDPSAAMETFQMLEKEDKDDFNFYLWLLSTSFPSPDFPKELRLKALPCCALYVATTDLAKGKELAKDLEEADSDAKLLFQSGMTKEKVQEAWDQKLGYEISILNKSRIDRNPKICQHLLSLIKHTEVGFRIRDCLLEAAL